MRIVPINKVSRELILEFLNGLTSELKFYTDFTMENNKRTWQVLKPESAGLAMIDNNKVVSIMYFFTHKSRPEWTGIVGMVTKNNFQNKGINKMLHPLFERLAIGYGIKRLTAGVRAENSRAVWVFIKNCYRITKINVKSRRYTMEKDL